MRKLFFALVAPLLLVGCAQHTLNQSVKTVKVDTVSVCSVESGTDYPGKVRVATDADLAFRVSGTILRIPVKEGQYVKQGTLLAEMDPRDYKVQLSATEAEYKQIKGDAERVITLYQKGTASQSDYDKAVYGLQQITAKYDNHKNQLKDTRLVAPFDGYVQKVMRSRGETIGQGMPVLSMINTTSPEVEINIPANEYVRRLEFSSFECRADDYGERRFKLEPIGIARKANLNQLYNVKLRFVPTSDGVYPSAGVSVTVTIHYLPGKRPDMSIPLASVFGQDGNSYVWVYNPEDSLLSRRRVNFTVITPDNRAVVTDGVSVGEIVVSAGVHSVTEGMRVKPLMAPGAANKGGLL